jgi:hypothetical protein
MVEKTPGQVSLAEHARAWAVDPTRGGKVFQWGKDGDFDRCRVFYRGKMPGHMIDGWCATLHKIATGASPGHAPGELAAHPGKK